MQLALAMAATTAMAAGGTVLRGAETTLTQAGGGRVSPRAGLKTAWDGVYTEAQAGRGRQTYRRACSPCHGVDLAGGDDGAPALVGSILTASWHDKSLARIVGTVRGAMPKDNPGSLSLASYVDVIAFLLEANDVPAGRTELPPDLQMLEGIRFVEEANR
jgi:mono/diheme cytochrome c family protein